MLRARAAAAASAAARSSRSGRLRSPPITMASCGLHMARARQFVPQQQRVCCRISPLLSPAHRSFSLFGVKTEEERRERDEARSMPADERQKAIAELDAKLKVLTRRRAVLSGELYTIRGRFKAMGRDYGLPFMAWWTAVWLATGVGIFSAITYGEVDAVQVVGQLDLMLGTELAMRLPVIDPTIGAVAMTIACNEMLEPVRLPIVIMSTPTVVRLLGYK